MKVISAEFVTSAAGAPTESGHALMAGIPRDGLPQLAMAGRSNVGKSTLINALGRRKIARTSAAPGKTRLVNIYRLTLDGGRGTWALYLVDLPGYGYARGGVSAAAELRAVAEAYFATAARVADPVCLLLVDSRHPGLDADSQAARWLESSHVEYRVVATKIDKLSRTERARNLKTLEITLDMPPLPVSAASGEGLDALWKTIVSLVRAGRA